MPVSRSPTAVRRAATLALPAFELPPQRAIRPRLTIRLVNARRAPAVLWLRSGPPATVVAELLHTLGTAAADSFELMAVTSPSPLVLVRAMRPGIAPPWPDGFAESAVAGLYLPVGRRLSPAIPPPLAPPAGKLSWLTEAGGLTLHTATHTFRPLSDWWAAAAPHTCHLTPVARSSPFDLVTVQLEASARPPAIVPPSLPPIIAPARPQRKPRAALLRLVAAPVSRASIMVVPSELRLLEARLVAEDAIRNPAEQAAIWSELAAGYRGAGRETDAAVCRLNAAWHQPELPADWPSTAVPREEDRPVRAVWLTAVARFGRDRDTLALARCRDRLLTRLAIGPEPDLEVPSFVRRSPRRSDPGTVRDWLLAAGGPVRKWLAGHGPGTKLTTAGLDADPNATRCYAELIRAWASATVGDRAALGRAVAATTELIGLRRLTGINPVVHRLLGDRFLARVRTALTGQAEERPLPTAEHLAPFDRYVVGRLLSGCESLGAAEHLLETPAAQAITTATLARTRHQPDRLLALLDTLDPATAAVVAGPLFRAAHALSLTAEAAGLVTVLSALRPPPGGRRDLNLAVGRYLTGDTAGGDRALDAGRQRLFVTGVPDPRQRGELAVAYAAAVGHAAPELVLGRLDELFRRLGPVSGQGACGRYFALQPLRVVDAAVRAAVGDDFAPSDAVRRWLAGEELATRRRIARDIKRLLGAECRVPKDDDDRR